MSSNIRELLHILGFFLLIISNKLSCVPLARVKRLSGLLCGLKKKIAYGTITSVMNVLVNELIRKNPERNNFSNLVSTKGNSENAWLHFRVEVSAL